MQTENFVFLLTDGKEGLSDFSTVQKNSFFINITILIKKNYSMNVWTY